MLLDVRMPGMNGMEVLRRRGSSTRKSASSWSPPSTEEETGREPLKLRAFDYIVKPLNFDYLERSLWYKVTTMLL